MPSTPDTSPPTKRFRIAFSFAGEKREFVEQTAKLLADRFGDDAILYDKYHEAEFARHDLGIYLPQLYGKQSDLIVPVLCARYDVKRWTGWEWLHIYGLLTREDGHRVMPSRFEYAQADGLSPASGFIELDHKTPEQFASLILERLALNEGKPKDHYTSAPSPSSFDIPHSSLLPHNLPALQPFFGRTEELRKIADALDPESRTWGALIDGPGGMGKTSLAVRAAQLCMPEQFERIVFVSLKSRELDDDGVRDLSGFLISGLNELLNELARELGHADIAKAVETERPRLLLDVLRGTRTLLILDNLESLLKKERDIVFTFVKKLPVGCKAILTSRGRIGSGAEELILEKLDQAAALQTLAKLAETNLPLAATSEKERVTLYTQTGGKPLLLRWTAGQIGRGSCVTFTDAIAFLRSCPPDNDPLEFIFGDLVQDFTPAETAALCALTYFTLPAKVEHIAAVVGVERASGQTHGRAEAGQQAESGGERLRLPIEATPPPAVASTGSRSRTSPDSAPSLASTAPSLTESDILTALKSLTNRSLVVPDGEFKTFTLVPLVADYLRKAKPEVITETGDRLEQHALALLVENGFQNYERFPVLDAAWPTVAAALPRFLAGENGRLQAVCVALVNFLDFTGRWDERLTLSRDAEGCALAAEDIGNAGWCAYWAGMVHYLRGQSAEVLSCADRVEAHWCEAKIGARERSIALRLRGLGHRSARDYPAAIAAYREAVELRRTLGRESDDVAIGLNDLAGAERFSGDFDSAERDYREALRIAKAVGYQEGIAAYTGNLASLALDRQDWPGAEALARDALPLAEKLGRLELIASNHHRLALALVWQGQVAKALPHAQRAVEIYQKLGIPDLAAAQAILRECEAALAAPPAGEA